MSAGDRAAPAARFGDYELLRYFTAGGMADLYLARNPRFGPHPLVLKQIQERYLGHTRVVRMFIDEGRIARVLDHPNIVRVVDVGQTEGTWYIAMEYIHGLDLVAVVRRCVEAGTRIPRAIAVAVLAQVAAGLDYAHARSDDAGRSFRIVHCDVSPGNVVLALHGLAKIVDFGIARATLALRAEDGVAGKYNYMAPEQVRGEPVDARADLFALGVMLHELTVGRRLFRGPPEQVMRKVCDEPIPRPSDLQAGYPPLLERIVMRLLERDPGARYPSAAAALADLRAYLAQEGAGATREEIALFLRGLSSAPRSETSDPEVVLEDVEVDRGMPGSDGLPPGDGDDVAEAGAPERVSAAVEPPRVATQPEPRLSGERSQELLDAPARVAAAPMRAPRRHVAFVIAAIAAVLLGAWLLLR